MCAAFDTSKSHRWSGSTSWSPSPSCSPTDPTRTPRSWSDAATAARSRRSPLSGRPCRPTSQADARRIAETALSPGEQTPEWLRDLGTPPTAPAAREAWLKSARSVAACRQLHSYHGTDLINTAANRIVPGDPRAATAAAEHARRLAAQHAPNAALLIASMRVTRPVGDPTAEAGSR
jgi:hypothetical protein